MAANVIVYCLEQLTDYFEFERLCSDIMIREGYPKLVPLGGNKDKGRDALHECSTTGKTTIFAYSVREDWQAKLIEDAEKIKKHRHKCDELVFLTTENVTPTERDNMIKSIKDTYGWSLDIYYCERLRLLLENSYQDLINKHPQIFTPDFFKVIKIDKSCLFISFDHQNAVFADWLSKKLTAEGYEVWCELFSLKVGENPYDVVNEIIKNKTVKLISIISNVSLKNPEMIRHRVLAGSSITTEMSESPIIPILYESINQKNLGQDLQNLTMIPFFDNWSLGLSKLLDHLVGMAVPKVLPNGKSIAINEFKDIDVVTNEQETLYTNCFEISELPSVIHKYHVNESLISDSIGLHWAFVQQGEYVLCFTKPTQEIIKKFGLVWESSIVWDSYKTIENGSTRNIVVDLIKKSLIIFCLDKGLKFDGNVYFPDGLIPNNRISFKDISGRKNFIQPVGKRKYWRPSGSQDYIYHLSPLFRINTDLGNKFFLVINLRIRLTDSNGFDLPVSTAISRRKHLCKDWWNDDWLKRTIAVAQFLFEGDQIVIGDPDKGGIKISSNPFTMYVAKGIDESQLKESILNRPDFSVMEEDDVELSGEEDLQGEQT